MSKPSPDRTQPGYQGNPERLSTELDNLQQEIRRDYDKRIVDLSALMGRFKALMVNEAGDPKPAEKPDHSAANDARSASPTSSNQTRFDANTNTNTSANANTGQIQQGLVNTSQSSADNKPVQAVKGDSIPVLHKSASDQPVPNPLPDRKRAQFERGLYQLNSQLLRYRLELDQEMEFRQEPLHVHFRNQSELANILQQIALDMHKPESNEK